MQGLQTVSNSDPLGIDVAQRRKARLAVEADARRNADPSFDILHPIATNPAMEQTWGPFLEALRESAGGKKLVLKGGANEAGSNRLVGASAQPRFPLDSRSDPFGPHGFIGANGGDEGDMYALRDNQFASTNPAMGGLSGLLRKKR
jgi:hypothetical protein